MQELGEKVAVVTGAASGIGRAIAVSLAGEGTKLALLDVDRPALEAVGAEIVRAGCEVVTLPCDVSDRAAMRDTADAVFDRFGAVHLLVNNAGVTCFKAVTEMTDADWDWMIGVDLMSVIHGYQAYVPRMVAQGVEGHVVNSSSGVGVVPDLLANHTAYAAAKGACVALTSSLRVELAPAGIGVSVLCPGMVATQILSSERTRPERFGGPQDEGPIPGRVEDLLAGALDPMAVGRAVVSGIKANRHFIFTHEGIKDDVARYYQAMLADFDAVAEATA